jgi:hypothetical protein
MSRGSPADGVVIDRASDPVVSRQLAVVALVPPGPTGPQLQDRMDGHPDRQGTVDRETGMQKLPQGSRNIAS